MRFQISHSKFQIISEISHHSHRGNPRLSVTCSPSRSRSLSLLPPQMAGIISCTHPPAPGTDNACVAMLCDSVVESVGMVGMGWVTFLIWQVALFGRWPGSHLPCRSAVLKETDSIIHLYFGSERHLCHTTSSYVHNKSWPLRPRC